MGKCDGTFLAALMLVTVTVLEILRVSEDQAKGTEDGNSVARLIGDFAFEKNSHHDEEESDAGQTDDPGETVFSVARNKSEGRRKEDDESDRNMHPSRMSIGCNRRKKEGKERHNHAVNDTCSGKGDSETIPNFFHS